MGITIAALLILAALIPVSRLSTHALTRARDVWLRGVLAAGCVWLAWAEPIFCPLGLWCLIQWRGPASHPAFLGWLAVVATWFLARALPADLWPWVVQGWLVVGASQVGLIVWQRWWGHLEPGRAPYGTMGQRTMMAGFLALLVPFSPWWGWPVLGLGLWLTGPSLGALLSLAAGVGLLYPPLWLGSLLLALPAGLLMAHTTVLGAWLPRGDSMDSVRGRVNVFRLAWRLRREPGWFGHGPQSMAPDLRRWQHMTKVYVGDASELHCDPLQLCWEYGAFGVATVLIAGWRIGSGLRWDDPWSAAAVIGAVLSLTSFPLRVAPLGLVTLAVWAKVAP
jgi:hypothetical protein